jgi:predicted GNAT superfamily acetyltransferase
MQAIAAQPILSSIEPNDIDCVLELNQSEQPHVSGLERSALEALLADSFYSRKIMCSNQLAGFFIGFDQNATYQSMNYLWFKERYKNFFYIDRIAISPAFRRKGLGKLFYADIETFCAQHSFTLLTCEVNTNPPNPDSMTFHKKMGFKEVGTQDTEGGKKSVCMLLKALDKN